MKKIILPLFLFITVAGCTSFEKERETFIHRFPLFNNEILGEIKYYDPKKDLRTLIPEGYRDLWNRVDTTSDMKEVQAFISSSEEIEFLYTKDSFLICLKRGEWGFIDNAETPQLDGIYEGKSREELKEIFKSFREDL